MKSFFYLITASILFAGCTNFTFQPEHTAPKTEHDKIIYNQQQALKAQQEAAIDNYRY